MILRQLLPGDKTRMPNGAEAILVGIITPHPLYPQLWMAIWRVRAGKGVHDTYWSPDALSPLQDVGELVWPRDKSTREDRLRVALLNDQVAALRVTNAEGQAV